MRDATCKVCGIYFKYQPAVKRGVYCSNKCQSVERSQKALEISIALLQEGKLTDVSRNRIKKTLLATGVENKCAICGISEWLGKPLPFILDHINGDSSNNTKQNLRLICSNCDSQTDFYKGRNKGRGRKTLQNK